jgi:Tfp pilus assembly protein PilN
MKKINLLPKPKQKELMYERLFHNMLVAVVLAVCILMTGVVSQLVVWGYLERSQNTLIDDIDRLKKAIDKTESAQIKQEIRLVNSQMKDFEQLSALQPKWSSVLNAFAVQVPPGVQITDFVADSTTLKIDINGQSPTREQVIQLYNNLSSDQQHFKNIDYPLENVAKPKDVRFHFTFYIQDGVLVPKK